MLRWLLAIGVTATGLVLTFVGLAWGTINVGVPYPDPTPAQAAAQKFHLSVSGWCIGIGGAVFAFGILSLAVLAVQKLLLRSPNHGLQLTGSARD